MKKSGKIISGLLIVGLVALVGMRLTAKKEFANPVDAPVLAAEKPVTGDILLSTSLIGTVEPADIVYVYPKASGDVTGVSVKTGDYVSEGQVLCTIDTKQVDSAKNSMDTAAVSLRSAEEDLSRMSVLYESGGISNQTYEQYRNNVELARLQYESARTNYNNQVSYSTITAPISGVVETVDIEVHDTVSQGNLVCVISGEGNRVLSFNVTERIKDELSAGDVIFIEKQDEIYSGIIYEISMMADSGTGLYQVKAAIDEGTFSTGTSLKLNIISDSAEGVMTVPVDAVYYEGGEAYVYTYDNGIVHKNIVEVGIYDSACIEIMSGLQYEDLVITTWSSELYEGAEARLKGASEDRQDLQEDMP